MALLFPRVIKSCTFKMTSDPCSLKKKKKNLEKAMREGQLSISSPPSRNDTDEGAETP